MKEDIKCGYGCGKKAIHQFKNGKWCCENKYQKCPSMRALVKKQTTGSSNPMFGKKQSEETKMKISKSNKDPDIQTRSKMSISQSKRTYNKGYWKGGYDKKGIPHFDVYASRISYAEDIRRNIKDPNILEVRCTYCNNWFAPSISQVQERGRALEKISATESRFYCSDKCKLACPIYKKIKYAEGYAPETSREVQPQLRQMRFEKDNYTCQKCKKHQSNLDVELHCHHLEGIRWEPIESADVDKVITLCKNCHIEVHKKEGCSYHDMKCERGNKND